MTILPTILFIKNGKFYEYVGRQRTLEAFYKYANGEYQSIQGDDIPLTVNQFKIIKKWINIAFSYFKELIKGNYFLMGVLVGGFLIIYIASFWLAKYVLNKANLPEKTVETTETESPKEKKIESQINEKKPKSKPKRE